MRINASINCVLFSFKIIGLINECTAEFWCSQIHRLIGIQYFKLIVGEMLTTSLRFFSNFTFVAFQLCRLSLIGKEHGKLVELCANQMSIKRLTSYFACLSLILSIVKFFRFQINDADRYKSVYTNLYEIETIDEYPVKFSSIDKFFFGKYNELSEIRGEIVAFVVINCLCDMLNYMLFLIVCLVLDIVTARELRSSSS
jgi:hypothetical protein